MFFPPTRVRMNPDRRTTTLWFPPQPADMPPDQSGNRNGPWAEFHIRGGVCWPDRLNPVTNRIEGYAVLLGHNLKAGVLYCFEETPIIAVDHVVDATGRVLADGCAPWFNQAWSRYYCSTYYHRSPPAVHARWSSVVYGSRLVAETPHFVDVDWKDDNLPQTLMLQLRQEGRLEIDGALPLWGALQNHRIDEPEKATASIRALWAALMGLDAWPWRPDRREREDEQ